MSFVSGTCARARYLRTAEFKLISEDGPMKKQLKELQQLDGIGDVLAQRLIEASYDSIAKVASAEVKALARIAGLHPGKVRAIVIQARKKVSETEKHQHSWQDFRRRG